MPHIWSKYKDGNYAVIFSLVAFEDAVFRTYDNLEDALKAIEILSRPAKPPDN